jgi:superfamily II DNA or RNA helicase
VHDAVSRAGGQANKAARGAVRGAGKGGKGKGKGGGGGGGGGGGAGGGDQNQNELSRQIKEMKPRLLVQLLRQTLHAAGQALVFCRTNVDCDALERYLTAAGGGRAWGGRTVDGQAGENPLSCCVVAGLRSNSDRQQNLAAFKAGEVRVLICTDIAARGIDIKGTGQRGVVERGVVERGGW